MKIAIFNGYPYHYEMYGYLLYWAKINKMFVTIYDNKDGKSDMGFLSFYKKNFTFDHLPLKKFYHNSPLYHIIFLPTEDDYRFLNVWLNNKELKEKTIRITHTFYNIRKNIPKVIDLRKYTDKNLYALHCYPISSSEKKESKKIKIFVGNAGRTDVSELKKLLLQQNIKLYFVGRQSNVEYQKICGPKHRYYTKIDAEKMINIMKKCSYYFYSMKKDDKFNYLAVSGYLSLALSCGTPIICTNLTANLLDYKECYSYENTVEELFPLLVPNNKNIIDERNRQIEMFDKAVKSYFPSLFEKLNDLPVKKIHFLLKNNYLESWKYFYPDFEFKFYLSEKDISLSEEGIYVPDSNLYCYRRLNNDEFNSLSSLEEGILIKIISGSSVIKTDSFDENENNISLTTVSLIILILLIFLIVLKYIKK